MISYSLNWKPVFMYLSSWSNTKRILPGTICPRIVLSSFPQMVLTITNKIRISSNNFTSFSVFLTLSFTQASHRFICRLCNYHITLFKDSLVLVLFPSLFCRRYKKLCCIRSKSIETTWNMWAIHLLSCNQVHRNRTFYRSWQICRSKFLVCFKKALTGYSKAQFWLFVSLYFYLNVLTRKQLIRN